MLLLLALACSDTEPVDLTLPPTPAATSTALSGTWSFAEECGENAGGTPVSVYYTLTFEGDSVRLDADGYQTMTRIVGTLKPARADAYTLLFEKAGEESMFPDAYRKGQALLNLSLLDERSGQTLIAEPVDFVLNCTEKLQFTRQ